jgi:hypothetical protein
VRSRYRLAVSDDRAEGDMGDILDAIIAEGSYRTCGMPWASVVKMEGDRLVKIEGGCPKEVCVLGDCLVPLGQCPPQTGAGRTVRSVMDGDADTRTEGAST